MGVYVYLPLSLANAIVVRENHEIKASIAYRTVILATNCCSEFLFLIKETIKYINRINGESRWKEMNTS
jgi:hypothetical protein